ncbi:MAG: hypothetical protein QM492_02485 [Rhodobacterales bacterium]
MASATSGAGGSKVGLAGSLGLNIVHTNATATISSGASVNLGAGASDLHVSEDLMAIAEGLPVGGGATGNKVGVGASVALNFLTTNTVAEIEDGVTINGGGSLAVGADAKLSTTTKAEAGAAGGIAVDAVVALALLDETTKARIGAGNALTFTGAMGVSASNTGVNLADADGKTKSGSVGVGASAAVILGSGATDGVLKNTSITTASLQRNVTAGSLSISASSIRTYEANATATAGGGKFNDTDPKKTKKAGGTATSADSLDKTKGSQRGTKGGAKVTVAAAAGIAVAQDRVAADLGAVTVNVVGGLSVTANNESNMATFGSGLAVSSSSNVGVGIGVGLGILNNKTTATIADGATVTHAGDITVSATSKENADPAYLAKLTALGVAGASAKKVSVAGALAVGISTGSTKAIIGDGVTISSARAISVNVDNTSHIAAKALSGSLSTSGTGVGAAVAVVVSEKEYKASVGSGANVTATSLAVSAISHKVNTPTPFTFTDLGQLKTDLISGQLLGANNYYVEAIGGAAASQTAVQGSFGVMVFDDKVSSTIGESRTTPTVHTASTFNIGAGGVTQTAQSDFLAKAISGAISLSGSTGVGVSSSVIVSSGTTIARLAENTNILGAEFFASHAIAAQDIQAFGISAAAGSSNGIGGVATVITATNRTEALIDKNSVVTIAGNGAVTLAAKNDFKTTSLAGGAAGGGSAGIGAGASVVVVNNVTRAALADGTSNTDRVEINATGAIRITASATETGKTFAAAGAAAGSVAVGVGIGTYVLGTTTEALAGNYAKIGNTYNAGSFALSASDVSDLLSVSGGAGIGGSTGAGAGVSVGVLTKTTRAMLGTRSSVLSGDVLVSSANAETLSGVTIGLGVGFDAGLAGAVGVYAINTTTTAQIGQNVMVDSNGNAAVLADDRITVDMLDGSAAIGTAGIGAAVGVSVILTDTMAKIDDSANVSALGNGAARNFITSYDDAFISYGASDAGSFNKVDIDSNKVAASTGSANNLLTSEDARAAGLKLLTKKRSATAHSTAGRGVIVNASGANSVRTLAVGGSAGGVAISLSANVPVITTKTQALVGNNVLINQNHVASANVGQMLAVSAVSDIYVMGFSGAVAAGGTAGGAGVSVTIVDNTTRAKVGSGGAKFAAGNVLISAMATEDFTAMAAAGAIGGGVGLAGGASTIDLTTVTEAELGGVVTAMGNVDVVADDQTRSALVAGSVALGGTAGIGAAVGVINLNKTITATIANSAQVSALGIRGTRNVYTGALFSATQAGSGVSVLANSVQSVFTLAVAGAAGLTAGVSGVVMLELMDVTTTAKIGENAAINTSGGNAGANGAQDVVVAARDSTVTSVAGGGFAAGLTAGLAGAVDVGLFKNTTAASIGNNTTVNAKRDVLVSGLSNKAGDSTVVSGAIGLGAIAAGVAIYSYGDGIAPGGEADKNLKESSDSGTTDLASVTDGAQGQARNGKVNDLLSGSDNTHVASISAQAQSKRNTLTTSTAALAIPAGTSASIGSTTITAGGTVGVRSSEKIKATLTTGGIAGGGVGVGAGIGIMNVDTGSTAKIDGGNTINAGAVIVGAVTDHKLQGLSFAGTAGLLAAVSADVALFDDKSRTSAFISGKTIQATGAVAVNASATRYIDVNAVGVAVAGIAGVGASVSKASISGTVSASVSNSTIGSNANRAGSAAVHAIANDSSIVKSLAAGGGVGAAIQGAGSIADVAPIVTATVTHSAIYTAGLIAISSSSTGAADTKAEGYAVAGILAAGGSLADATIGGHATTTINSGSTIDGGSINIGATSNTGTVKSNATGSSGALVGLSATISHAKSKVEARTAVSSSTITASGNATFTSLANSNQKAEASGSAGGLIAAGFNESIAGSTSVSHTTLMDLTALNVGSLTITANGNDVNQAETVSGSGGLVAGAAATAKTNSNSNVSASLVTSAPTRAFTAQGGAGAAITANHTTTFGGSVDSTQASFVGASGADITHTVNNTVNASIGNNVTLYANNLLMAATNRTINNFRGSTNGDAAGWNVNSISGGLASVPAGGATVNITHATTTTIGANATVHLLAPTTGTSLLSMEASNDIGLHQKVKLDSGGAIALASAEIGSVITSNASMSIGDNSDVIVDIGDINMAAWNTADVDIRAAATTYGLAGAPSGKADVVYNARNTVAIGTNARLEATDGINPTNGDAPSSATITIATGKNLAGTEGKLTFNAVVDVFNKTAIPIPTAPNPTVVVNSTGLVTVGSSSAVNDGVRAAGDIRIAAGRGIISARAVGTGKDIYREALAKIASAVSNAFGGGDVTFDYHGGSTSTNEGGTRINVLGNVETGLQRHKTLDIRYQTVACDAGTLACIENDAATNIDYTVTGPNPVGTDILIRVSELRALIAQYADDPIANAAYASEIHFLENKLVDLGLGSYNPAGAYVPGTYDGPSPRDALLAQVAVDQGNIGAVNAGLIVDGNLGFSDNYVNGSDAARLDFVDPTHGVAVKGAEALAILQTVSTYDYANTTQKSYVDTINTALLNGTTAANQITAYRTNTVTRQGTVKAQTAIIVAQQGVLATALIANDTAGITVAQTAIANAKNTITSNLTVISANNTNILAKTLSARNNANTVNSYLGYLKNFLPTNGDLGIAAADITKKNGAAGAIATVNSSTVDLGTNYTNLNTAVTSINTVVNRLNSGASTAGAVGGGNSMVQYTALIGSLSSTLATHTQQAASASASHGSPTAYTVEVGNTLARLGNIYMEAAQLVGNGELHAPGDALIRITNYTSNSLKLGNLAIPTYDAGHLRLNGVLVDSVGDINALNAGGASAGFTQVETALTSGRGTVEIFSRYNAEDNTYYTPGVGLNHMANKRVAPDITLKSGAVIENQGGAVKIHSDSGNIYINGKINAGSVDILAKNGDFVASYVNGFNHIGGDPAAFSGNHTDGSEAGPGITANGSISIAARYLNINSTIQSGIANWNLTLNGSPVLTSQATSIGLTQAQVNAAVAANVGVNAASTHLTNSAGQSIKLNFVPAGVNADELAKVKQQYLDEVILDHNASPIRTLSFDGVPSQINIKDYLSGNGGARLEFSKLTAENYYTAKGGDGMFSVASAGGNIGAAYDARTGKHQYVVNGASVHGGYIQIFGQIMNTASTYGIGALKVLDGFGTINVTNTSDIPLVMKTLNTGDDPTGTLRGTAGVIKVTDVVGVNTSTPNVPYVTVKTTTFTRNYIPGTASGRVNISSQFGHIDNATGNILPLTGVSNTLGSDRTATYTPTPLQRYVWATGSDYTMTATYKNENTQLFGSSALSVSDINTLQAVNGPHLEANRRLADGTYVSLSTTQLSGGTITGNGVVVAAPQVTVANSTLLGAADQFKTSTIPYPEAPVVSTRSDSHRSCNWWTLCIVSSVTYYYDVTQKYTDITTNSLRADYPVKVAFIGDNKGAVNVTSGGNVVLTNNITNLAGVTSITANGSGSIIAGNTSATIKSKSAVLAAAGSVGGVTNPLDTAAPVNAAILVNLTGADNAAIPVANRGSLSAIAHNGNVSMITRSNMIVDKVTAAGNVAADKGKVELVSYKSILAKAPYVVATDTGSKIQGQKVALTAINGSIGGTATADMLTVNAGYSTDPALRPYGASPDAVPLQNAFLGLSATASESIGLKSTGWSGNTDGNMLVNQVLSIGGDVRLDAVGQILDNNPIETIDTRTYNQLLGYWETLGLLATNAGRGINGTDNADKQANAITAFQNSKIQKYNQYWKIRTQLTSGGTFDPTSSVTVPVGTPQYDTLQKYFTDQAIAEGAPDVGAAVTLKFTEYQNNQTTEFRSLHQEFGTVTATYDSHYAYVATAAEKAKLTKGAVWTERELAFSIAPGALKTVTGTNPVVKDPNVSGRTVTINAGRGIGETVGSGTPNLGVSIRSSLDPRNLTLDQKVALAAAERNDLQLTLGPVFLPAGATAEQTAAFAAAQGEGITAAGSLTVLNLGAEFSTLSSVQQAALNAAALGMVSASDTLLTVLSKRPLNFNAATALNITVPNVSAAGNSDIGAAYLSSMGGAKLGNLNTYGDTRIKVRGNIVNVPSGSMVNTGNLILEAAQGGVGTTATPVTLMLKPGATTTARAQNGVNIAFTADGLVDTIYSPGDVKLSAVGSLLNANNDDLINVLGTNVILTATSGSIGTTARSLNVGVNPGGGITAAALSANGINLYGPLNNKFIIRSATAGGTINLNSAGDSTIDGSVTTASAINLSAGGRQIISGISTVHAVAGDIAINAGSLKMLNGVAMNADAGAVMIATSGDAVVTGITVGSAAIDAVKIMAGGQVFAGTLPTRTDITAMSPGAGVFVRAGLGIGDKTQADDLAEDRSGDVPGSANLITDTPNPLRIKTSLFDGEAANGSINVKALSDLVITNAKAPNGGLVFNGDGTLDILSATSGGTQNFTGRGNVKFTQLTTPGLPTDPGDITVVSLTGTVKGGNINANGSNRIEGHGVDFGLLTAGINSTIVSYGDITGVSQIAGDTVDDTAGAGGVHGSLNIGMIRAKNILLQATDDLTLPDLQVANRLALRANTVTASATQVPSGPDPLLFSLTGPNSTVGTSADVTIDAPAGVIIDELFMTDTKLVTTAGLVDIQNANVPGAILLKTPFQTVDGNNRSPIPRNGSNIQFYEPSKTFALKVNGTATATNAAFVVKYDTTVQVTNILGNAPFDGISLIRDSVRRMLQSDDYFPFWTATEPNLPLNQVVWQDDNKMILTIGGSEYIVFAIGDGPAVMLEKRR